MFVPAKRKPLEQEAIEVLKVGDKVETDSNMGGSFTIELTKIENEQYFFSSTHSDWPYKYEWSKDELKENIYTLVPDEIRY